MSLNVEQITSRLAQMPDAALQKYAAMNKNDPYIMALAVSESNRRKQMRQAAQAQQGQMQQPKVVDAAVQSMAQPMPEDTGIARLPAGNMNFAGGGIVAFADGGEVERYNGNTRSLIPPSASSEFAIPGMMLPSTPFLPQAGSGQNETPWLRRQFQDAQEQGFQYQLAQAQARMAAGVGTASDRAIIDEAARKQAKPTAVPQTEVAANAPAVNRSLLNTAESRMAPPAPAPAPSVDKAAPKVDTTRRVPGAPKAPAAAPAATATQDAGLAALDPTKMFADAMKGLRTADRPEKDMLEQLNKDRKSAAEQELASERALERRFADAYRGRRERLDTREAEFGRMKDQNFGLALLQAGAAMMSTRGNVGTAIGKGIQAGSQQYVAGLDKLNAAKDKLSDARDRLDDLQLNRDEMSARSIQKAENKIRDTAIAGQENMIRYIMERDKVDRETAAKIVDSQIQIGLTKIKEEGANIRTDKEIQGRITAARIGNQPPAQMQIAMALGNGDLEAGFRKIKEIEAGKFSVANSYADYLRAFAGKETLTPPMSFANYAAQFGATLPR
jgi:hypothetical protein